MNEKNNSFGQFHPISCFLYLFSLALATMFMTDPVILTLSFCGSVLFCISLHNRKAFLSDLAFYPPLFLILALTNPLFSHNGVTPLFFLNGNPVTLEAILYGMDMAAMMLAVMFWCKCFSAVMTSDKILYLFGRAVPRISLTLSMSLRFLPLFKQKWREIKASQIAMGYYSEKGVVAAIGSSLRVFSALVTWALENAVDTGASMKARGYGLPGRSHFSLFRFTRRDKILLIVGMALSIITFCGIGLGIFDFSFYPRVTGIVLTPIRMIFYAFFAFFSFFPCIFEISEALRWKYLRSKI